MKKLNVKVPVSAGVIIDSVTKEITFDFKKDTARDAIRLTGIVLRQSNVAGNVYLYGYEFTSNATRAEKSIFVEQLKAYPNLANETIDSNFEAFIMRPILKMGQNIDKINCIVYPQSRSDLNRMMIKYIHAVTGLNSKNFLTFEMLKVAANKITFDYGSFERDLKDDMKPKTYRNILKRIKAAMDALPNATYFSIADTLPSVARQYVSPFLEFPNDERIKPAIEGQNVLIVDDIGTSGITILQSVRALRKVGTPKSITIFTLLGKQYKAFAPFKKKTAFSHL